MICFCYFCQKKLFLILGVGLAELLTKQIGPEKTIFRGFTDFSSELPDCNRSY